MGRGPDPRLIAIVLASESSQSAEDAGGWDEGVGDVVVFVADDESFLDGLIAQVLPLPLTLQPGCGMIRLRDGDRPLLICDNR